MLLGRLGITSLVISRHKSTANTPRAHVFNQRAMEVMRDAGLQNTLSAVASPQQNMMHTSWLHSLAGEEYGRMYAFGNKPDRKGEYETASPCTMSDLPQSLLEPILVEHASKVGAEFRFYTEFVSHSTTADGEGIDTVVRDRNSEREYSVHSRYLIGADGARSVVLDSLAIPVDGKQLNMAFNVHIKAELGHFFAVRPGTLNWILNPDAPQWSAVGNIRVVHPWNEFVVSMHPAQKDNGQIFEPTEDDIRERLHQMIGVGKDKLKIDIISSFRWTINDQTARSWQKGNVICIGDAVHRHPPINGLGSNTCIGDAMNISWKLAYVLKGIAGRSLLDTITTERKPVGDGVVRRANEGMEAHRHLWSVIGLDAEDRRRKTELMSKASIEGKEMRKKFRAAMEETEYEQNGLGIQMNQRYCGSPSTIVGLDDPGEPDVSNVDLIKHVVSSTYPGYHLPHVWLSESGQTPRLSILDLCGQDHFTLLTGIGGESWREYAKEVESKRPGVMIKVAAIGWRQDYMDAYGDWEKIRGVEDDGAVLARPDQFVAWRCTSVKSASARTLMDVFDAVLPRP